MDIILFQPEIPPNTGNVARLCAATGVGLHLIEPLGFRLEDRYLKRAGLDYWPLVNMRVWPDLPAALKGLTTPGQPERRLITTSARAGTAVHRFAFREDDILLMGRETAGLPAWVYDLTPHRVRIPFSPERRGTDAEPGTRAEADGVRSINLATATGIVLYAALAACGTLDRWEAGEVGEGEAGEGEAGEGEAGEGEAGEIGECRAGAEGVCVSPHF